MTKSKEGAALRLPNKEGGRMWAVTIEGETVPAYHPGAWEQHARELSAYLRGLGLPQEAKDRLFGMMLAHDMSTAREAYSNGFRDGLRLGLWGRGEDVGE